MLANLALAAVAAFAAPAANSSNAAQISADGNGIIVTSASVGAIDPNGKVPTTNGVPGAGVLNWDIATPTALLNVGGKYKFAMTFHDLAYTGSCSVVVKFSQSQGGKNVVLKKITIFGQNCAAGTVYVASADTGAMPNAPGPVNLSVNVLYGSQKSNTLKVPMVLQ
jgi:hypothetical protein